MGKPAALAEEQLRALGRLKSFEVSRGYYLAGGSAIAIHLEHRQSRDLDLFSRSADANLEEVRDALLASGADVQVVARTDATLAIRFEGCAVDVVRYPYPLLDPLTPGPGGFPVAGLRDLATMKLAAIARRGIRRDFWDLHEIFARSNVSPRIAIDAYRTKFGVSESDIYHVLRSLTYFVDAEAEPLPVGLSRERWATIVDYFERLMADQPWR